MSVNYLEEKEKFERVQLLCCSLEYHKRSLEYTLVNLVQTEEFEQTIEKFEKIINDLSEFDIEIQEKAGRK